jgi:glycosyltransferase involved in cell wall biosynthesis
LIEAQAAGVPVVSRHVGGIAETMIAGETGLLVEEDTADALAQALLVAIGDEKWRAHAAARGPNFVRGRFDTDRMIETLSAIMLRK